ncbi:MAG TPA: hypothetical protein EYP85_05145 [Armatimonadetes bacterium]|nr:hypothetical protein [Armatimonadota bacterium]
MLLGVGTGICFLRLNPALATVALMSGLFHVVNHACYKSLLFLNAGAALYRTGTRDLNKMGGLMAIMPLTATTAIIASLSIAGIPPFSGFSSKWLIFQSTLTGGLVIPLFLALGCVAIFISAVTLASFLKFLGTAFFGSLYPEREEAGPAEVPLSMKVPQVVIAIFCVLFGVWPLLPVRLLYGAANAVLPAEYAPNFAWLFGASPVGINFNVGEGVTGVWNPLFLVGGLLVCCALAYALYRLAGAPVRRTSPWFCGEEHAGDEVRYKAHGFYLPFQDFLSFRIGTRRVRTYYPTLPRPKVGDLPRLRALLDFDRLYYRLIAIGAKWCERFSESHVGYPQMYVLWMAVGIVIAIAILYALS